ncbi:MAG: hypothetical protein DRJ05_05435 [Bacteroidetes bacterium]|nr:MAG: hypothetical protein DRJ05_05435 [Bacteroidota bacterium]
MGKKDMDIMREQKVIFVEGAEEKGIDKKKAEEVFNTMMEFAKYGFNRSHSAAYSVIAYQTAYVKAHYPAEYMAAVLTHNLKDIKKIAFFVDECKRQEINVLGPDINESDLNFMVNAKGEIRFGLAAIKNVGENAARSIIEEQRKNGDFTSIFDFAKRVNLRSVNKRSFEALAMAGAFDSFKNTHRAQYFYRENTEDSIFLEKVIKFAGSYQEKENSMQASLFGGMDEIEVQDPDMPDCPPWSKIEQLKKEKEVTGFYMSGHPLEDFQLEINHFCNITLTDIKDNMAKYKNMAITFAGIVTSVAHRTSKTGKPFGTFTLEDFSDQHQFFLFSEDYLKRKHFLVEGSSLLIKGQISERRYGDDLEVRINSIKILAEVLENMTSEILLKLPLTTITDEIVAGLSDIVETSNGNCKLKFHISDPGQNISVEMPSSGKTVDAASFIKKLEEFPDVKYKLT